MNNAAVQEWLRVRRELLASEAAFTDFAIKVANGEASGEELRERRLILEGLRDLCTNAYNTAFPGQQTPKV